ncbi:hypothetical protein KKG83_01940 [Candidatus Micrarchaeota archaeon]|nr:hypothetical protein [Candidatus Micrarchaeota archaeon]
MEQMNLMHFLIHLITFLVIFLPLFVLLKIKNEEHNKFLGFKSRNELIRSLNLVIIGLVPIAVYHLFEAIEFFGIIILPEEGTLFHIFIEHAVLILAFLAITWFLINFKKIFVELESKS